MTKLFNKSSEKQKRRFLRNNATEAEKYLWSRVKGRQVLGKRILRQYSIGMFVVDFFCPSLKLAIEVDGINHSNEKIIIYDNDRTLAFEDLGIKVIRFKNEEILNNLDSVMKTLQEEFKSRELNPPQSPLYSKGGSPFTGGGFKK